MNYTVLPSGYRRIGGVDLLQDRRSMLIVNLGAIVIALLLLLLGLRLHPFRFSIRSMPSFLLWFFLLLGGLVLYIILHELIHGIFMRHYSGLHPRYGFNGLYAYAGSDAFFDRKSYLVISLAPVVLLGAVLLLLCALLPSSLFWFFYLLQIQNLSGAAGDLYLCLLLQKMPADLLIRDSGVAMEFYSAES